MAGGIPGNAQQLATGGDMIACSRPMRSRGQPSRGRRTGLVFSLRLSEQELADLCRSKPEHVPVGTWIKARLSAPIEQPDRQLGITVSSGTSADDDADVGSTGPGAAQAGSTRARSAPVENRVILDLCSGTGAWSEPYVAAGYDVRRVTLPRQDVRFYAPPDTAWGVLAAPPCEAFSLARNGTPASPDELVCGLGVVAACLKIIALTRPVWWALENPVGRLAHCLGRPALTFEPWQFGDAWTKRTSLWGRFQAPAIPIGQLVAPVGSAAQRGNRTERARTPAGFARAFFEANP
jgi:hypothetical protein